MRSSYVRLATGPRIHFAEDGEPGGEPIVFLHGWPDSSFSFSRVLPELPRRWRSLVPDQRGFGDSEKPGEGYSIPGMAADVAALLDALSIGRATFVGHSFGTFVARRVAIAHPDRVTRLVLIGSGWSPLNDVTREVQASIRDLANPVPEDFAREFQASTIYEPIPEPFFERLLEEARKLPAPLWRATFDGLLGYDDLADLGRIAAPTLLLWGDRDAIFPQEDQERLAAAIPGAILKVYPEIGHCPNWECPAEVAADVDAFARGRAP